MKLRHLSGRTLLAYDAGTLGARRCRSVSRHLRQCPDCRRTLVRRRALRQAVTEATSAPSTGDFDDIRRRIARGDVVLLPAVAPQPSRPRPGRLRVAGITAALLVLASAGVAAVGVVGGALLGGERTRPTPAEATRTTGIDLALPPTGLDVDLSGVGDEVDLVIETLPGTALRVVVVGPVTEEPRFRIGSRQVAVRGVGSGRLRVGVPVASPGPVRVVAGDQRLAVVQDGQVVIRGRAPSVADSVRLGALLGGGGER